MKIFQRPLRPYVAHVWSKVSAHFYPGLKMCKRNVEPCWPSRKERKQRLQKKPNNWQNVLDQEISFITVPQKQCLCLSSLHYGETKGAAEETRVYCVLVLKETLRGQDKTHWELSPLQRVSSSRCPRFHKTRSVLRVFNKARLSQAAIVCRLGNAGSDNIFS